MSGLTTLGKVIVILVVAALVSIGVAAYYLLGASAPAPVACTMEAKLCPDGTAVGRTGPNCEFAACPTSTSTPPVATTTPPTATTTPPVTSGIRGTVMAGPTCPVERDPPDPACADKPLQTLVSIFRTSDPVHAVVLTHSNASGTFEASLPPGSYMVGAGESMLPRCTQTPATVSAHKYTTIAVSCDTGIR